MSGPRKKYRRGQRVSVEIAPQLWADGDVEWDHGRLVMVSLDDGSAGRFSAYCVRPLRQSSLLDLQDGLDRLELAREATAF